MGGCASRPKEFDSPVDAPISSEKPQLETASQDNTNGGESQIEKPLVDLSEPEKEAAAETDVVETVKPTEDDVKAAGKNAEDKVEATSNNTTEVPAKEAEADHKSNDAPSKEEVKSDAPLASL